MPREMNKIGLLCLAAALGLFHLAEPAMAQAFHHPFAVGAQEGAVGQCSGLSAWIIEKESGFLSASRPCSDQANRAAPRSSASSEIGFGYGVFHAAGPGHGKAVITSYMVSNERALKRGIVISALAALLQGVIAIVLIGCAALIFNATAQKMTEAAHILEVAAYCGIVLLGLALIWRKGSALVATVRGMLTETARSWSMQSLATEPPIFRIFANAPEPNGNLSQRSTFRATDAQAASAEAGDDCGPDCAHLIDPNNSATAFLGSRPRSRSSRPARGPARVRFWYSSFHWRRAFFRSASRPSSPWRLAPL